MEKVRIIHGLYLSSRNGVNTVINSLLDSKERFAEKGFDISFLSPDTFKQRSFSVEAQKAPARVWRSRLRRWLKDATKYSKLASDLMIYITDLKPGKNIVRTYLNSNPDSSEIAFFHSLSACYYFLKWRKQKQHTVVVLHTNGDTFKTPKIYFPTLERSLIYKKLLKMEDYVIRYVDKICFVSETSKQNFIKLHPEVDYEKVFFIYNGEPDIIKAERSNTDMDVMKFCCVASISKRKGQRYAIEALKMFKKGELPKVHFTFVGDGPDKDILENDVKKNGLDDYVLFAGVSENVDEYLVNSDAYILPSEDEGLPMGIIEAMRASLPIISTPVGGIPEMIDDGVNGIMIQPSAKSVYDLLANLNKYDWKMMGIKSRKTFEEKFEVSKMIDGYIKLLSF